MTEDQRLLEVCSIGKEIETDCHKNSYTQKNNLTEISSLTSEEINILSLRTGVRSENLHTICEHHKIFFLKKYEVYQKECLDPFKCHKKKITKSLREINFDLSQKINQISSCKKSIPGQKICNVCRNKIYEYVKIDDEGMDVEKTENEELVSEFEISVNKEKNFDVINSALETLGESPLKFHAIASHNKANYAKRKIESVYSSLHSKVGKVLGQDLLFENSSQVSSSKDLIQKADDLDNLVELIKTKLSITNARREKIQILTLAPPSWSKKKICEVFQVSEYSVRKARELLKSKGILALPEPRKGQLLQVDTINKVIEFYENDEYSRIMPGMHDKISISRNVYKQKRLIMGNLNELYSAFKLENPNIKVGISKFCMLRPKWCVLAGSAGTHSICVCSIHQNVVLLLHASRIEDSYNELIEKLICSRNKDCMLRHCDNCPSNEILKTFIMSKFDEWDPYDEITFSSWVSTDRTQQVQFTVTFKEYLDILLEKLEVLIPHSFITKSQAQYLKYLKSNLDQNTAIILLDFSENYSFVIQDEAQGYHWSRNYCTLHPVIIYTYDSGNIKASSLCVLSDDLEHDVSFVYATQNVITSYIKITFPNVKKLHYYSDGCAAQYKNCKNFINLCHHKEDFNLAATWSFFATSHGKSPCDGIGGSVKRLLTKASLQISDGNSINTVEKCMEFCEKNILNVKFWFLKKEYITEIRKNLEFRFLKATTIPGTRSFHCFIPLDNNTIATKRISADENFSTLFTFCGETTLVKMSEMCIHNYVACKYEAHWFFGIILSKHEEEGDVKVRFMHPHGPSHSFYWPSIDDICLVPVCNIISCIDSPTTKGSGRMYYFPENTVKFVHAQFTKLVKKCLPEMFS